MRPIKLFGQVLIERGIGDAAAMDALEAEIAREIDDAVTFSDDSPYPEPEVAFRHLYTDAYDLESLR